MSFLEILHSYFRAEKTESAIILAVAFLILLSGVALLALTRDAFARGPGIVLLAMAAVGGVTGGVVFTRTDRQAADAAVRAEG